MQMNLIYLKHIAYMQNKIIKLLVLWPTNCNKIDYIDLKIKYTYSRCYFAMKIYEMVFLCFHALFCFTNDSTRKYFYPLFFLKFLSIYQT